MNWPFDEKCELLSAPEEPSPDRLTTLTGYWVGHGEHARLAYMWLVPRQGKVAEPVSSAARVGDIRLGRVTRISFEGSEVLVLRVLRDLLAGKDFHDAILDAGAEPSDKRARGLGVSQIAPFVAFPWTLRSTRDAASGSMLVSPHDEAPSLVRSLVPLDLGLALAGHDPLADEDVVELVQLLEADTGTSFGKTAMCRLGAIEAYFLPSANGDGRAIVTARPTAKGLRISYRPTVTPARAMIRVRQEVRGQIRSDQLVDATFDENGGAQVELAGPPEGPLWSLITIWTTAELGAPLGLAYEHRVAWISQVAMQMNWQGHHGQLKSDWLEQLGESRRGTRRQLARELLTVSTPARSDALLIGDPLSKWEEVLESREALGGRLATDAGIGGFFAAASQDEGEGRGSFVRWIQERAREDQADEIVFADPHIDALGVDIAIRARRTSALRMRIVCRPKPESRASMELALKQVAGFSTGVEVLISQQDFHDRMMVTLQSGELKRAYLISNSLAGANKRTPIVTAAMDTQVALRTWAYVRDLAQKSEQLRDSTIGDVAATESPRTLGDEVTTEWASSAAALANDNQPERTLARWAVDPTAVVHLAAVLLAAPNAGRPLGLADSTADLEAIGIYQLLLGNFVDVARATTGWLNVHELPLRASWAVFFAAKALAMSAPGRQQLCMVASQVLARAPGNTLAEQAPIASLINQIVVALGHAAWSDPTGVAALLATAPASSIRALTPGALNRNVRHRGASLSADEVLEPMKRLQDSRERVLACAAVVHGLRTGSRRAYASAQIRESARANEAIQPSDESQTRWIEADSSRELRIALFNEMLKAWPSDDVGLVEEMLVLVGGPLAGSWMRSTYEELLEPLIRRGALSQAHALAAVGALLTSSIERQAERGHEFYAARHVELSEVFALLLARTDSVSAELMMKEIDRIAHVARRRIRKPFGRSNAFDEWSAAVSALSWIGACSALVLQVAPPALESVTQNARRWTSWAKDALGQDGVFIDPAGLHNWATVLLDSLS